MDRVHIRTRHTSASVTYDGSFSTDTKDRESLESGVVLQITHASGVIEVSEIADSSKMHVVSTTKTVIHYRGPKQSSGGSPWVGSVEGGGDVKDIFADGTLVISPYQAVSGVQQPPGNTTTIKTPGGAISIKRDGSRIDVETGSGCTIQGILLDTLCRRSDVTLRGSCGTYQPRSKLNLPQNERLVYMVHFTSHEASHQIFGLHQTNLFHKALQAVSTPKK